jgi:methylmalonyl-CoA mutase cobalamin-binding domain/chain
MPKIDWDVTRKDFLKCLIDGDTDQALDLSRQVIKQQILPVTFFEECINPSLNEIGKLFENLEIYLPEMTQAGKIVKEVNQQVLEPEIQRLVKAGSELTQTNRLGKVLLATVKGDIHDIGKNMVSLMLKVNGFDIVDLGTNVPPLDIIECAEKEEVDIIGLSSLLTTCLPYMKDVTSLLESKGIRGKYKVIIGGASPTEAFAKEMGADGFGNSAPAAVRICKGLINGRK